MAEKKSETHVKNVYRTIDVARRRTIGHCPANLTILFETKTFHLQPRIHKAENQSQRFIGPSYQVRCARPNMEGIYVRMRTLGQHH